MSVIIPMSADGDRIVTVNTGPAVYSFRSYYSAGPEKHWLLDISDANGAVMLEGVTLVSGSDNLLKGQGDAFDGVALLAVALDGDLSSADGLGKSIQLFWINAGEDNPFPEMDPLLNISDEGII